MCCHSFLCLKHVHLEQQLKGKEIYCLTCAMCRLLVQSKRLYLYGWPAMICRAHPLGRWYNFYHLKGLMGWGCSRKNRREKIIKKPVGSQAHIGQQPWVSPRLGPHTQMSMTTAPTTSTLGGSCVQNGSSPRESSVWFPGLVVQSWKRRSYFPSTTRGAEPGTKGAPRS